MHGKPWTEHEDKILIDNYALSKTVLSTMLGRTPGAVTGRLALLRKKGLVFRKNTITKQFSDREDDEIKKKQHKKVSKIAEDLGRNTSSVYHRRRVLRLTKKTYMCDRCRAVKNREYQHAYYRLKRQNDSAPMIEWVRKYKKGDQE